ncbi:phospholipase-like protein [Tanacetum coccineum]
MEYYRVLLTFVDHVLTTLTEGLTFPGFGFDSLALALYSSDSRARTNGYVYSTLINEEARVNCIEHHNGMCGDTDDGNFVEGIDETIYPKSNQMLVEEGVGVLDSEGDGVHLSQTNDVIQQAVNLSTMSSTSPQAINPAVADLFSLEFDALKKEHPSSSSSHPGNDKDASHLDDLMEIDGENVKGGYTNSQDHLHLLIKALESKTENPSLDVVVPPKVDDFNLRTIKPNDAYDVVELEQEPDKFAVKQGILEQQSNAPKGKTTVFEDTVGVKVNEKPGLDRKKKLAMALKPPFGLQSATTLVPKKRKSRIMKIEVIVPPFDLEDFSGQPQIRSINHIMTHEPFVENMSRTDDCKSDKVTVSEHMCEFITNKALLEYQYPWGKRDIVISRSFWLSLSCLNTGNSGWLNDHHLDLWIDLMWSFRPPEADWAIVYFPVNEPKTHWCLAELEIRTGVVTFYDSLGWAGGSRRRWWRRMKKLLPEKLTVYLVMHGIFESKCISADDYKIIYKYADAPFQASLFGDCGIWGSWYVFVFTLSSMDWIKLENDLLPREFIRFQRSSQAVVGQGRWTFGKKGVLMIGGCGSNSINIIDDYDVNCFLKDVLESGDAVKSVFIKSIDTTVKVTRSSSSKPLDIDLNIPLFNEHVTYQWKKNTLTCIPTTPHAPILDLKTITSSKHGVKLAKHKIFDDKEACMYEIGFKCLTEGYEYKVVRSCPNRYAVECVYLECYWDVTRVYKPKDIINDLNIEYNFDVSYKRDWKAKQLALESNQGCPITSFAQLPYYCYNLKLANRNTITHIDTDNEGRFKMLFIGFGAAPGTNIQNMLTYTYSNTKCLA